MAKRLARHIACTNRPPPQQKVLNRLLAALAPDVYERISRTLDVIPLELKTILHKPDEDLQHIYFPGSGFCSLLAVLQDGIWSKWRRSGGKAWRGCRRC